MREKLRKTAIDIIGDVPWGTHFCQFYQSKEDLIEILVPYFKAGLQNNEFCMWITSEPLNVEEAKKSLKRVVDNLDDYIGSGQIEILDYSQWYTKSGMFEADKVLQDWVEKHDKAVKKGFDGLRLTENTFCLEKKDWQSFTDYEAVVNSVIGKHRMLAICSYPLDRCQAGKVIDVVSNHQFALIRKEGKWTTLESSDRKKAEQIAKVAREYAESIVEIVREPLIVLDTGLKVISANHSFYQTFKVNPEETKGRFIYDLGNRQWDIPKLRTLLEDILPKNNVFDNYEIEHNFETIGSKTMLLNARRLNTVQMVLLAIEDITERKQAEETIRENSELYHALFEQANDAIFLMENEYFVDCNKRTLKMFGVTREQIINQAPIRFSPEFQADGQRSAEKAMEKIHAAYAGEPQFFEWTHTRLDGTPFDAEVSLGFIKIGGRPLLQAIVRDITNRKQAEAKLQEAESRLRLALLASNTGTWKWDTISNQDTRDAAFNKMLGLEQKDTTQPVKDFIASVHPEDRQSVEAEIQRSIKEHNTYKVEFRIVRPDGEIRYLSDRGELFYDNAGRVSFMTGAVVDITERKKSEESLRQLNKDLESTVQELNRSNEEIKDFANVIAHNLKSPLRAIGILADWIATDYSDKFNQEGKEQIKLLKDRVTRMSELIDSVLRCSEIRCVSNQREKVNLNTLLTETIDQIAPPESIEITIENELPTLICEKAHLTEVFQNLMSNAVKYMDKPQGRVRIGCVEEDGFWKFSIADNGPGIKEQHFERIFKIFQALLPFDELGSTGIGLTIVKKIVELYGGKIWLESKVGEGSTFLFTLPKQKMGVKDAKLKANTTCRR